MPQEKREKLPQDLYHGYGFGSDPEQRDWALHGGAAYMIDSANKDYAREQARKAGAYKKDPKVVSHLKRLGHRG